MNENLKLITKKYRRVKISEALQAFYENGGKIQKLELVEPELDSKQRRLFPTFKPRRLK